MSTDLNVLFLEDNPSDVELMLHELRRAGFNPTWRRVETEADFLAHLSPDLDVILSDYTLPQFDAPRALELLRRSGLTVPAIVVSGTVGEDVAVLTMRRGAADYLLKDRIARLGPAVNRVLERKKLRDEAQQMQAALQESEELHRITLSNISEAIFITDDNGEFTYICPSVKTTWGYTVAEIEAFGHIGRLLGQGLFSIEELEAQKEIKNIEQDITNKAGNRVSLLITVKRVSIKGGTILYTCRDVTNRKQAEKALQEAEARYRSLVEQLPTITYIVHLGTPNRTIYISPQVETLLGFTPEEWLANPDLWFNQIHPDDREWVSDKIRQSDTAGEASDIEYRILTRNGEVRWFHNRWSELVSGAKLSLV